MKKLTVVIISIIGLSLISSCKKEDKCKTDITSLSGSYKKVEESIKIDNGQTFSALPQICEGDNVYSFNANGNYSVTEGAIVCDSSQATSGTWSYSGSTLTIMGVDYAVGYFDCLSLRLNYTYSDSLHTYLKTITLQKIQ